MSCARLALALVAIGLAGAAPAAAQEGAEQRLIEDYAPRVMIREQQDPPCEISAEQYRPTSVDVVLGNPTVELTELAGGEAPDVAYAHLAREQGREGLAVQYWFFWYFNQFNDLHEGDWEGMQIAFESSDPERALAEGPSEIALYQHAGGERAAWDDPRVEKDGTHPVVYAAAGSHATFYDAAVYVENGRKGSGVGCDNTATPHERVEPAPVRVPTRPRPGSPAAWLTYEGRWGQYESGFNNGPTGPAMKSRWLEPLTWMEGIRTTSPRLPAGSVLGPTVTKSFCGAVADVTSFMNHTDGAGWILLALAAALLAALALVARSTRWGPVDLTELRAPRAFGQILRTAASLYRRGWRTFALLGLSAIPVVGGTTLLSWQLGGDTGRRLDEELGHSGFHVAVSEAVSGIGQPIASAIVAAAVIVAIRERAAGRPGGFLAAYRGVWERFGRVVGAQLLVMIALTAMAVTVVGLPFAAWKYVAWLFVQQQILFEDRRVREAFRGSAAAVRGRWWYTLRVAAVLAALGIVAGPILGFALIFTTLPLWTINAIGTIVFALLIPYVAIGQTLLYLDLEATADESRARTR